VAASVAASWVVLLAVTGSATGATVVLALIAGLGVMSLLGLRALGVTRDHPWVQQLAARPWRDGQEVLQLALRHLPEMFVITPSGSLLAPNAVELQLNPEDLRSLCERMEIGLISVSAAEIYEEQVAARGARFAGPGPAYVRVIAGPSVPAGRYRLRQGQPVHAGAQPGPQFAYPGPDYISPGPQLAYAVAQPARSEFHRGPAGSPYPGFTAHDGNTRAGPEPSLAAVSDMPTAVEQSRRPVPLLRLVTGDSVAETTMSGARAGRGAVELGLPEVPTVSREHGRFTFTSGQWWITNLGMNGITVNGVVVASECPLSTGDSIRWGTRPDALLSWVEIN
jgi:FHA domain